MMNGFLSRAGASRRSLTAALLLLAPLCASAQKVDSSAATSDDADASRLTWGTTLGAMQYPSGISQQGVSVVARVRVAPGLAIGVTPAWGHVNFPASLGGGSTSGFTDVPVELTYDHALPLRTSPVIGAAFAVTLPVGDTATGFGSGAVGYSISAGLGFSPAERVSVHAGAGRPLTDFSAQGALGGSATTWGDLSVSWAANDRVSLDAGFDGDLAGADTTVGPSRALALGAAYTLRGPLSVNANILHGVSGAAANWSFTLGFGTDFAYLESLGSSSPMQSAAGGVGGQSHSHGWGTGSTAASGHGRGKP